MGISIAFFVSKVHGPHTSSGGILEQLRVDGGSWEVDVSDYTSSDEDILHTGL